MSAGEVYFWCVVGVIVALVAHAAIDAIVLSYRGNVSEEEARRIEREAGGR